MRARTQSGSCASTRRRSSSVSTASWKFEPKNSSSSHSSCLDPEIFLLAAGDDHDGDAVDGALELLPDVPAGKLAVADVPVSSREQVEELERAGVDAVIVGARHVADLAGDVPPPV